MEQMATDAPRPADDLRGATSTPTGGQAALLDALTRAEAAVQLGAGVAHDVRNALHVVLGCAELLAEDLLTARQREFADDIRLAASHAVGVLGDFMALARPAASTVTTVDPGAMLEALRPLVRRVARSQVECVVDAEVGVWPVAVEAQQLEAVLLNLCANARDAMPGGGRLAISVRNVASGSPALSGEASGGQVAFSVQDNGTGMPTEVLDRATDAFFTTRGDRGGTGLGLAMARQFATRNGGGLRIESAVGQGTTVELLLPRARPPVAPDAARAERRDAIVEAIRRQIRTPWLRDTLDAWHRACGNANLPGPLDVDVAIAPHADMALVALAEAGPPPGRLTLLSLGRGLQDALRAATEGDADMAGSLTGSLGDLYRRVAASGVPGYESSRYVFDDGAPATFERLVMPASADGHRISHLVGVVAFSAPRVREERSFPPGNGPPS